MSCISWCLGNHSSMVREKRQPFTDIKVKNTMMLNIKTIYTEGVRTVAQTKFCKHG